MIDNQRIADFLAQAERDAQPYIGRKMKVRTAPNRTVTGQITAVECNDYRQRARSIIAQFTVHLVCGYKKTPRTFTTESITPID